jgi:hypothetical protein
MVMEIVAAQILITITFPSLSAWLSDTEAKRRVANDVIAGQKPPVMATL